MNYQFAPFRVGVSDVTQEEMEKAKAAIRSGWSSLKNAAIDLSLAAAEVSLRYTVDGLQAATYELADVHAKVALKQSVRAGVKVVKAVVKDVVAAVV